jgi:hypothetical protein
MRMIGTVFQLHIDPSIQTALEGIRRVKEKIEADHHARTPVAQVKPSVSCTANLLNTACIQTLDRIGRGESIDDSLRVLIGLCADDSSHASELGRKGGVDIVWQCVREGEDARVSLKMPIGSPHRRG